MDVLRGQATHTSIGGLAEPEASWPADLVFFKYRTCANKGRGFLPVAASTLNQQLVLCCSVVSSREPHGIFTKTLGLHSCSHQTAVVVVTAVAHAAAGLGFFAVEVFLVSNYVNPFYLFFCWSMISL